MIYTVPFQARHFKALKIQSAQTELLHLLSEEAVRAWEGPYATTVMRDGTPVLIAGVLPIWEERAYLWSFLSDDITPGEFVAVHRATKRSIDGLPYRRVEAAVEVSFEQGHRWVKALGFECETPDTVMKAFMPNGGDCKLYAKVK